MGLRFEALRRVRGGNEAWWRYGANGLAAWSHLAAAHALPEAVLDIDGQLTTTGVAVSHVEDLFGDVRPFTSLRLHVERLLVVKGPAIRDARAQGEDSVQVSLTGEHPTLRPTDPLVRFVLDPRLVAVPDHFYRMPARLLECKVWQTIAGRNAPVRTQRWHRDRPGDRHVVKCFVYLNDVDDDAGPFCFALGSQRGQLPMDGVASGRDGLVDRFDDATVESAFSIRRCSGPAGTVIFANTTGLHMGGRSTAGERLMLTAQFGSAAAWQRRYFDAPEIPVQRSTAYALGVARPPRAKHMRMAEREP
ncbi:MAG: hypothetical protein JO291_15200 [Acidimicrobiia bacterium]|nr:hypothetical protein [Acidimicrobiia bacterium]